jgi:hypothetical protein
MIVNDGGFRADECAPLPLEGGGCPIGRERVTLDFSKPPNWRATIPLSCRSATPSPSRGEGKELGAKAASVRGDPVSSTGVNAALTLTSVRGELVEP